MRARHLSRVAKRAGGVHIQSSQESYDPEVVIIARARYQAFCAREVLCALEPIIYVLL